MKTAIVVVLAMVMMAGVAMAQEQPNIRGLEITGHEIIPPNQECPDVQVTCNCNGPMEWGTWEGQIKGKKRCGEVILIPGIGFEFEDRGNNYRTFLVITDLKRLEQVDNCGDVER